MGGSGSNALPVELLSFSGDCDSEGNILTWQTASEFNSSHFVVEWSRDGINWESVQEVSAYGFSNENQSYSVIHKQNQTSTSYYRLSQFDLDGTIEIFVDKIIELRCNSNDDQNIQIPHQSFGPA